MREVAARAGVSVATVSRVISGSPRVKPDTAAHVQKIIDELNFVPNASATTLKYGRSNTYGIIIANVTNPYFLEFLREFESLLTSKQQGVLLANAEFPERVQSSIRRMLTSQVEGVVVMPGDEEYGPFNRLALKNIPVVTFDRRTVAPLVSDIAFRFDQGMMQAVDHLVQLGHSEIALIGGTEGLQTSQVRRNAFTAAMKKHRLPVNSAWIKSAYYTVQTGDEAMRQLMSMPERPTAVIAVNDLMAFGAMRAAHAMQLNVPRDVSIVGFDNILLSDAVTPSLTTVNLPRDRVAHACMRAFEHMAKSPQEDGLQIYIDISLVVRESTAPPSSRASSEKQSAKKQIARV